MEYGHIPGISAPISRLVQGTVMLSSQNMEHSFALLDGVFAQGCTTFDTAHGYGGGDCERVFGQWLRERGVREQVVIIGKGAHPYDGRQRVTPHDIAADLHDSLERMGVDHIDLYLLHRDDPAVPVGPIMEALNDHQRDGLIRAFGGSNWQIERIEAANAYAAAHDLMPMAASSPNFSLADQHVAPWAGCISISGPGNHAARAWYEAAHMPLFTWSSLAGGFWSGRFRRNNLDSFSDYSDRLCVESYCAEDNFQRLDRAEQLAAARGVTLPQIALAFVLSQPLNIFALVGCNTVDEFRSNAQASTLRLTPTECAWLDLQHDAEPPSLVR